ncbi:MAG: amidohydrolase [Leptospiraceae bacterium]|nr:amidohydrolase [Leptospiraceae bacterium]
MQSMQQLESDMKTWRRELHQHPELAFEENWTADYIHQRLLEFGFPAESIARGIGGTGIVATLCNPSELAPARTIALRADMDALSMNEAGQPAWHSRHPGRMHACGHDGHMAMLLGAAKWLRQNRSHLRQTVRFLFQPAEENEGGARVMLQDGLLQRFPIDAIFGLHNFPGFDEGVFVVQPGSVMASYDNFTITIQGRGGHAAMPHLSIDPVPVAGQMITALQSLVSRGNPLAPAVLSITRMDAGSAFNIIPDQAVLRGTVRSLDSLLQDQLESQMRLLVENLARAMGATAELQYQRCYPVTRNDPALTEEARLIASAAFGADQIRTDCPPSMGSEDFAFFSQQLPACYAKLGAGSGPGLHNTRYDFNDRLLVPGCRWWCALAMGPSAQIQSETAS